MLKIRKTLLMLLCALAAVAVCAQTPAPYFPLPDVPEKIENFNDRTDYLVEHYWDRCPWKSAFSSRPQMRQAFVSYLDLLPLASAQAAHASLDNFLKHLRKQPQGVEFITDTAIESLYSDSAMYTADEVLLKFLDAGTECKKVPAAKRSDYRRTATQLRGSQQGMRPQPLELTLRDGSSRKLDDIIDADTTRISIIFIADPRDSDAALAKLRLDADPRFKDMVEAGYIDMITLYPGNADEAWRKAVADYPAGWIVAASTDAESRIDHRVYPGFMVLDGKGIIVYKNLMVDDLINLIYSL